MKAVIVIGDPIDGFEFIWFEDREDAIEYADNRDLTNWWVAPLYDPNHVGHLTGDRISCSCGWWSMSHRFGPQGAVEEFNRHEKAATR